MSLPNLLNHIQIRPDYTQKPIGISWRSHKLFIISTVGTGLFADLFLYSLLIPVYPFLLQDRLGYTQDERQRYTSALLAIYAVSTVIFSIVIGIIESRFHSRKGPFLFGLWAMLAATILLFLADDLWLMFLARALQGASGASIWVIGLALLLDQVGPEKMGQTTGPMFAVVSSATLVAPFAGGSLYHIGGYAAVFAVAISCVALDLFMRLAMIDKKTLSLYEEAGTVEPAAAVAAEDQTEQEQRPLLADEESNETSTANDRATPKKKNNDNDEDLSAWVLSKDQPYIFRLYKVLPCLASTRLLSSLCFTFTTSTILGGFDATVPIVSADYFGFNSLQAGLLFTPILAFDLVLSYPFGLAIDRFTSKWPAVFGLLATAPILVLLRLVHPGGSDQIALYACLLGAAGATIAACGSASIAETGHVSTLYDKANPGYFGRNGPGAQMYSLSSAVYNLGLTAGPELASSLRLSIGYGDMNLVFAGLAVFAAGFCYLFMSGKPTWLRRYLGEV